MILLGCGRKVRNLIDNSKGYSGLVQVEYGPTNV